MDEQLKQMNDTLKRFEKFLTTLRISLHFHPFRFNTGSDEPSFVQKQHCYIDGIHNPNTTNTLVTLKEEGVVIYSNTLAPGDTTPPIGMPFMRECVLVTDGNAVTIWGRIRA